MYTQEQFREALRKVEADHVNRKAYTEDSVDTARARRIRAEEQLQQAEAEAQQALSNRMVGYMHHDARSRHLSEVNARVQAAKNELREAKAELDDALKYAAPLAARKRAQTRAQEQEHKQQAEQAEFAKQQEAQAKEEMRTRYLASGGTPEAFERAWLGLWEKELERRTLEQATAKEKLMARLRASGRYSF